MQTQAPPVQEPAGFFEFIREYRGHERAKEARSLFRSFRASDSFPAYLGRRCVRLPADFALPQAGLLWPFGPEIKLRSP